MKRPVAAVGDTVKRVAARKEPDTRKKEPNTRKRPAASSSAASVSEKPPTKKPATATRRLIEVIGVD